MRRIRFLCLVLSFSVLLMSSAAADFLFSDDRFQGDFTTENMDRIIEEYELFDGWYWTTEAYAIQTFHGTENAPGWTDTAVNKCKGDRYRKGYYGCRWRANRIFAETPGVGGYGECFGFAMFVGYLLSGSYNPYMEWQTYYTVEYSDGLRVGDILRADFTVNGKDYGHSAVVYSVTDDEILFIQVAGGTYNRISVPSGFSDGYHSNLTTLEEIGKIRNYKVCRSPLNTD